MQSPTNESELIQRAQKGDKEAVSALYQAYAQAVFQYVSYRVDSDTAAEDLTAEVFLRMVRSLPQYRDTGAPFGAWLFRVAANQITDFHRQHRARKTEAMPEDYHSSAPDLFEQMAQEEERSRLRAALRGLPEDYQTVLVLRFMQDLPHADVASIVGKSVEAVRVLQHRALRALAAAMNAMDEAAPGQGANHDA